MGREREASVVEVSKAGERLDTFLAGTTGITRSQIQKFIENGDVLVNGERVSQNYRVKIRDSISLVMPERESGALIAEPLPVEILYHDAFLVVVNKPAGMVVYPSAGHSRGTLMNALAYQCERLAAVGGPLRPGVVHRLDKETSGVMVVAVDDKAYYNLVEQFRQRTIRRRYVVLIYGNLKADTGEIALPIGRSETDRKKMSTRARRGREAVTRWEVIRRFDSATMIYARLGTGRTHQIRVHFASVGHPVIGDRTYGHKTVIEKESEKIAVPRQMLHAETLGFHHPVSGEYREFSSPVPADMQALLNALSNGEDWSW